MSTPSSRKTYTRRNTRTRLIDLLKEAIELVEKGCPPGHMATTLSTLAKVNTKAPLSAIVEENLLSQANSLLNASQVELENVRSREAQKKGVVRPGVLKYNEFVKKWISEHPEYQAKGKYQAALKEIQRSGNWDRISGTRRKTKSMSVAATPGRVNVKVPMTANVNTGMPMSEMPMSEMPMSGMPMSGMTTSGTPMSGMTTSGTPMSGTPMSGMPMSGMATSLTPTTKRIPANTNANASLSYTNEGMNDTVGMRKISMNGRTLYLSSDDGVFEREGNSPGDFIGRLVNGELVQEEAPELPEYS